MRYLPAERTILLVIAAVAIVDFVLIVQKNVLIGMDFFAYSAGFVGVTLAIGQFYRVVRDGERIALTANAVGFFIAFTVVSSLFNVLLLPRPSEPIDALLVRIDAWFGYSWPALCAWFAQYPQLNGIVRSIYTITLVQMLFVFMFLGLSLDRRRLHAASLAAVFGGLCAIFIWALFPSAGPGGYFTLAPEIDRIVRPIGSSALGVEINRMIAEGVRDISTISTTGLIGFPSFHTVMALLSLVAIWPYRAARYVYIALNAFLLPGILVHGGHHLMDVVGGAVLTLVAWRFGCLVVDAQDRRQKLPPAAVPAVES
jgi:hypothetical protein